MAYDSKLVARDGSTNLTATETSAELHLSGGTPIRGLECEVVVPSVPTGTSPTLIVTMTESKTSGGSFSTFRTYPATINAAGEYKFRFQLDDDYEYAKVVLTVGGTTPNFGKVVVNIGGLL